MLLRRLVAALCPLLLCAIACGLYIWLDGWLAAGFLSYLLKGLLLGACLALVPPIAGVKARLTGLTVWLLVGAGLLAAALLYQYLASTGAIGWAPTPPYMSGQTVLAQGAVLGYMLCACAVYRGK